MPQIVVSRQKFVRRGRGVPADAYDNGRADTPQLGDLPLPTLIEEEPGRPGASVEHQHVE